MSHTACIPRIRRLPIPFSESDQKWRRGKTIGILPKSCQVLKASHIFYRVHRPTSSSWSSHLSVFGMTLRQSMWGVKTSTYEKGSSRSPHRCRSICLLWNVTSEQGLLKTKLKKSINDRMSNSYGNDLQVKCGEKGYTIHGENGGISNKHEVTRRLRLINGIILIGQSHASHISKGKNKSRE